MNLPKVAELTPSEAQARVHFAFEDDLAAYLPLYQWPFSKILEFTHLLSKQRVSYKKSNSENQEFFGVPRRDELGCSHGWGMITGAYQHERTVERIELRRKVQTQFWYGTLAVAEGDLLEYFPQQQLHRMMSSYHERKLKEYELTDLQEMCKLIV